MSSAPSILKVLLQKYLNNNCTADELQEFWLLMSEISAEKLISAELKKLWIENNDEVNPRSNVSWDELYEKLQHKKNNNKENGETNMLCGKTEWQFSLNMLVSFFTIVRYINFFVKRGLVSVAADINNIKHLYIQTGHSNCELK